MSLTILQNKPTIGTTNEEFRLDLTYPSVLNRYVFENAFAVVLKKGEEMRPDLLSINMFGNPHYYDMVLKANGISNPFSIDTGEVFFSPELNDLIRNNAPSGRQSQVSQSIRDQYINPAKSSLTDIRMSIVDAQRLEIMKKKSDASPIPGSLLPPNVATDGEREIVIKGGKIYFGKDVVRGKEECTEPLSKSEFLARLIKNRVQ